MPDTCVLATPAADNVAVVVRVRHAEGPKAVSVRRAEGQSQVVVHGSAEKVCTFDQVFDEESTQQEIFELVGKPLCEHALNGYNTTIFAYGQTGAGKTHTMHGPSSTGEDRGLVPRVMEHLFALQAREERHSQLRCHCVASYLEIYNETVIDLLDAGNARASCRVREDVARGIFVENIIEEVLLSPEDALRVLATGSANRQVGSTAMNRESSRSHSVLTLSIRAEREGEAGLRSVRCSAFNLVDLAGSERQKDSGSRGARLKEACNINKSLSALGNCITALVGGAKTHVPYRDSKLTMLLKDSLGGNARTCVVASVSPLERCCSETVSTLNFAQRAKLIQNRAVVNESATGSSLAMQAEIARLKRQIADGGAASAPRAALLQAAVHGGEGGGELGDEAARISRLEMLLYASLGSQAALQAERDAEHARNHGYKQVLSATGEQILGLKLQLRLRQDQVPSTCRAHAVLMPCSCRAHAVHMPCTCRAHAVHMPCPCRAHAVHMPCTCRAHAVHMPCRAHAMHASCTRHARARWDDCAPAQPRCRPRRVSSGRTRTSGTRRSSWSSARSISSTRSTRRTCGGRYRVRPGRQQQQRQRLCDPPAGWPPPPAGRLEGSKVAPTHPCGVHAAARDGLAVASYGPAPGRPGRRGLHP